MMVESGSGNGNGGKRKRCEWKMLEVGALRVDNAAARSGLFARVERIDLHAQADGIRTQDFMERPLPSPSEEEDDAADDEERFDVISLSLVLNYVGDAVGRGQMLKRVEGFLRRRKKKQKSAFPPIPIDPRRNGGEKEEKSLFLFPGLFLVLPASCVTNSRYLDEDRLEGMMQGLGYRRVRRKLSQKLVYYFWRWVGDGEGEGDGGGWRRREERNDDEEKASGSGQARRKWPKEEIKKGAGMNNFAIILK